eukprot:6200503-Pleurochrysis_carterae.AAC.2
MKLLRCRTQSFSMVAPAWFHMLPGKLVDSEDSRRFSFGSLDFLHGHSQHYSRVFGHATALICFSLTHALRLICGCPFRFTPRYPMGLEPVELPGNRSLELVRIRSWTFLLHWLSERCKPENEKSSLIRSMRATFPFMCRRPLQTYWYNFYVACTLAMDARHESPTPYVGLTISLSMMISPICH